MNREHNGLMFNLNQKLLLIYLYNEEIEDNIICLSLLFIRFTNFMLFLHLLTFQDTTVFDIYDHWLTLVFKARNKPL